jgi:hypothetical protein
VWFNPVLKKNVYMPENFDARAYAIVWLIRMGIELGVGDTAV